MPSPTPELVSPSALFRGAYADKRVLVTGHTGFKGSWLCEWLLELGAEVTGLALSPPTEPALFNQLGLATRLRHVIGDVRDAEAVRRVVRETQPDFMFHLAAQPLVRLSYQQPAETYAVNVMGTVNVLNALRCVQNEFKGASSRSRKPSALAEAPLELELTTVTPPACAAVFVTTDKCYENREWIHGYREDDPLGGHDPYSSSKAAAEIAIASFRRSFFEDSPVRIASARAGNVIGGGDYAVDRIVPDCIRALQAGQPIAVRNPRATRPWQHVLEPLSGYLWLAALLSQQKSEARSQKSGISSQEPEPSSVLRPPSSALASAFNFGPGHDGNRTVGELVQEVLRHWPGRWEDRSEPNAVHEASLLQLATDKAHALLGWRPLWEFRAAIEETVRWYREVSAAPQRAAELTRQQIQRYQADGCQAGLPWSK